MTATMHLNEIAQWWDEIERDLVASGGEVTPEIQAKLDAYNLMESSKIDAYGYICRDLKARTEATKTVIQQLGGKVLTLENIRARLIQRVKDFADGKGLREVKGRVETFNYRGHGGKKPLIVDETARPEGYAGTPFVRTTHEWDREAIRKALLDEADPLHSQAKTLASEAERGESFGLR